MKTKASLIAFILFSFFLMQGGPLVSSAFFLFGESQKDTPSLSADKSLYHSITFSPKNGLTESAFLAQNRGKILKGVHIMQVRNVPVLTYFICGNDAALFSSSEYFFNNKNIPCAIGARFFPGKNAWEIDIPLPVVAHAPFVVLDDEGRHLVYRSDISYEMNQMTDGTKAIFHKDGRITNDLQKPIFPSFVYTPSGWSRTMPMREFFELKISENRSYKILLFSDNSFPLDPVALAEFIDLQAEKTPTVHATVPQLVTLTGSGIMGVATPTLNNFSNKDRGIYKISLTVPGTEFRCQTALSFPGARCNCIAKKGFFEAECTVTDSKLSTKNLQRIQSWLKQIVPPFIVIKKAKK
ncbi:hypothetical protein KAH37_03070 [bacterium]|nr:hypothetical protein [bacterium]